MKDIFKKIENNEAEHIGDGSWEKDSRYQIYKVDGKFYSIIQYDPMSLWLMDDTLQEIPESKINDYI